MVTNTLKHDALTIQEETLFGNHLDRATTKGGGVGITQLIPFIETALRLVEGRHSYRPKSWSTHRTLLRNTFPLEVFPRQRLRQLNQLLAIRVEQACFQGIARLIRPFRKRHLRQETHLRSLSAHLWCRDLGAPNGNMRRLRHDQMHIAIQSRTGIPTRGFRQVLQTHR